MSAQPQPNVNSGEVSGHPADLKHWLNQDPELLLGERGDSFTFIPPHISIEALFLLDHLSDEPLLPPETIPNITVPTPDQGGSTTGSAVVRGGLLSWDRFEI